MHTVPLHTIYVLHVLNCILCIHYNTTYVLDFSGAYHQLFEHVLRPRTVAIAGRPSLVPPSSYIDFIYELLTRLLANLTAQKRFFDDDVVEKASFKYLLQSSLASHSMYDAGEKEALLRLFPCRKYLFSLNNTYPIALFLAEKEEQFNTKQSSSGSASNQDNHSIMGSIKKRILNDQELFCSVVLKAIGFSSDDLQYSKQFEKDATSKAKVLKTRFSCFNACMDVLGTKRGEWRVTNADLRASINSQLKDVVLTAYSPFFKENCNVQFSKKHSQQYLRYPPPEVGSLLANYF